MTVARINWRRVVHVQPYLFVATDERDKSFYDPLEKHDTFFFLDDFLDQIKGINSNYFGMIDQLIASQGRSNEGICIAKAQARWIPRKQIEFVLLQSNK